MSAHVRTPSIVPDASSAESVYLMLDDFGLLGRAYVETDEKKADQETVIDALMTGQFSAPVRVVPSIPLRVGRKMFRRTSRKKFYTERASSSVI